MQDIVVDLLNIGVPLLVEPFTETETVSQLIIPPKESISKTLDYLNTVRVFYNTGYRFFMDFENTYLVSKAGKATLRTLDKYETVKFNLAELGSSESLLEGFKDDGESKSYIIDVPTTDIKYGKDNVINKELNGFTAVIDASKTIQQDYMSKSKGFGGILGTYQNIMNTIDNIKKTTAGVRNIVKNIHRTTYDIKGHFNQIVEQATSVKSTVDSVASQAETLLRSLPEEVIGEGKKRILGGKDGKTVVDSNLNIKNFLRGLITNSMDMSTISRTTVEGSEDTFNKFKQKYTGQIYHLENFKSLVGGIDPINFTDNTSEMLDQVKNIQPKKDESREHHTKSMVKFNEEYGKYIGNNKFLVDTLKDAPDTMTFVLEYDEFTHEIKRTFDLDLRSLKSHFKELKDNLDFSKDKAKTISDFTETMDNSLKVNSNVGKSLYEADLIPVAKELAASTDIPVPVDVRVGTEFSETAPATEKSVTEVKDDESIFDIGDKSAEQLAEIIKNAKTVLWNGPVGVFEFPNFRKGTEIISHAIANSDAFSIAGGGDTLAAIDLFGIADKISYISTGGGAFLEFVEGKVLPGVAAISEK